MKYVAFCLVARLLQIVRTQYKGVAMSGLLPALDLFSGIGGHAFALRSICKTVAYCEIDPFCRTVLARNMGLRRISTAPVFEDVTKLRGKDLHEKPAVITASFPCQDISLAGRHAGFAGKHSQLYFEVVRLIDELKSVRMVFLENTPDIVNNGLDEVLSTLCQRKFACVWGFFTASEVGALHRRRRWYLLAVKSKARVPRVLVTRTAWNTDTTRRLVPYSASGFRLFQSRMQALGNSIVPQCAAHAWNILANHVATKDPGQGACSNVYKAIHGMANCTGGHRSWPKPVSGREARPLDLRFQGAASRTNWSTPVHNIFHAWPRSHATGRSHTMLVNQLFHERQSQRIYNPEGEPTLVLSRRWMANAQFIEKLMGYPKDWTAAAAPAAQRRPSH